MPRAGIANPVVAVINKIRNSSLKLDFGDIFFLLTGMHMYTQKRLKREFTGQYEEN